MELLNKIQQQLKVPKEHQKIGLPYKYRNAEDILEAVKPLLGKEGTLILSDSVVLLGERYYVEATATLSDGKTTVKATAFARESLTKPGTDDAKITGAASSYARKYALNGLLCIDDTKDADDEDNTAANPTVPKKPSSIDKDLKQKKAAIADLLKDRAAADPTNLFDELKTKEDFEGACQQYLGMSLTDENVDAILKKLIN